MYMYMVSLFSCVRLFVTLQTVALPGSSVHGIFQARILEWIAKPFPTGSSRPRDQTRVSCLLHWQAGSLPLAPPGKLSGGYIYLYIFY